MDAFFKILCLVIVADHALISLDVRRITQAFLLGMYFVESHQHSCSA